jgi:hypothetical protein
MTGPAAASTAAAYFGFYGAGQYAAVYPMIAPAARRSISETVWIRLHEECRSSATAGLSYRVTDPILAGRTAVVTVGYAGAAASLGSEQVTFVYTSGKWYYEPADLSIYKDHDLRQALAAAKGAGLC